MSVYAGIDVHRKRSQVTVVTEDGEVQDTLGHSSIVLATDTYSPSRDRLQSG
jgi:hypothetical protein